MNKLNNYKTIGIIGGMGPEALVDMYSKVFRYFQNNFEARYDKDFPKIIMFSVPIPDVVENIENEKITLEILSDAAINLEQDGCDFIAIACNSVQFLLKDIQEKLKVPLIGIAEINAKYLKINKFNKVGILATETTIKKEVYTKELNLNGIEVLIPDESNQEIVTEVIMTQLAGKTTKVQRQKLIGIINKLKIKGAEAILLACTDLPIIISQRNTEVALIDCTEVYATECAKLAA